MTSFLIYITTDYRCIWLLSVQFSIDDVPFSLDFHLRYKFLIHEENISSWSASHYVPTQTSNKHSNFLFKNGRPCHACTKFFCKMFKMVYHFYSEERISAGHAWRKVCMTSRIRINMDPLQRYNKKHYVLLEAFLFEPFWSVTLF